MVHSYENRKYCVCMLASSEPSFIVSVSFPLIVPPRHFRDAKRYCLLPFPFALHRSIHFSLQQVCVPRPPNKTTVAATSLLFVTVMCPPPAWAGRGGFVQCY